MRFDKIAMVSSLILIVLFAMTVVTAQDEIVARAYRTVNVRSGPGTEFAIIGQLSSGNEVQITGRNDAESNWLRINFDSREGWVAFFTVSVLGNTEQLPVVAPREEASSIPLRPTVTATLSGASSSVFVTAYRAVNVRSGPGTEYVPIGTLQAGSTADVTGRSNDSEWLRIGFGEGEGWVAFFVVSLTGDLSAIEIVEADLSAETEVPAMTVEVVTRYNLNLRESPFLNSQIIRLIPFDTTLQAEARSDSRATWLRVTFNGESGWIIRALVNASRDLDALPVVQFLPEA